MEELNSDNKNDLKELQKANTKVDRNYYWKSVIYKLILIVLMSATGFGSYYTDPSTAALQDKFKDNLNITTTQYSLFFSINAWSSVVLCIFGGILLDRVFGIRWGTVIFASVQTSGQLLFSLGATINVYWVMIFGKFLYGAGDEPINLALTNYPVLWFKKKQLNLVLGILIAVLRFSSMVNFWTMEPIYEGVESQFNKEHAVGITLFVTSIMCIFSAICALILGFVHKRAKRVLNRRSSDVQDTKLVLGLKSFNLNFWILSIICLSFYAGFLTFVSLSKVFIKEKFHLTPDDSNRVISLVYIIPAVASPLFGLAADKTGKPLYWTFAGLLAVLTSILILALTEMAPEVGISLMGLGYSICSVQIWSMVALIIPEEQIGTAYGIMFSSKNLGLAVFSIFSGMIVDNSGYFTLQMYLIGFMITALIGVITLWSRDDINLK